MRVGGALPVLVLAAASLVARGARADDKPTLSGSWSASGVSESWAIGDWGEACGPKPRGQGAGGGAVQIKEMGGELSIAGAGRAWSTGQCWEQMPGLSRTSHSQSGGGRFWRTRCSTAANDPRRATVVTTTQATDSTIVMTETGQYQFLIHDQNCTASVTRSRSYTLVHREGDAAAAASASASPSAAPPASAAATSAPTAAPAATESKPSTAKTCDSPGDPARLEVFPSRKLLRPGERFAFRALVLDAAGCGVAAKPGWKLAPGPLARQASVDGSGNVSIADDAGEGRLELVASIAGHGVTIPIEVASPEHYAALLATSGLNEAGESEQSAVAVIATGTIGGREAVAKDDARERKRLFVLIVAAVAFALGIAGLALRRRSRRAVAEGEADAPPSERGASIAAPLPVTNGGGAAAHDEAHDEANPLAGRLPVDAATKARAAPVRKGKICPTCGARYDADSSFCGQDGTTLVLVN